MASSGGTRLRAVSSAVHHLATALWVGGLVAIYVLRRQSIGLTGVAETAAAGQAFFAFEMAAFALVVLVVSGAVTYFVSQRTAPQAAKRGGAFGLLGRHVAYGLASGVGMWWAVVQFMP